jgi:hypothetical protein
MTRSKDGSVVTERRLILCASLKAAREKRGVSLDQIAASTKINRSLFIGLEGGDLSRWPKGLYRRSYLRDYLTAVDLPPEPLVAELVRLFPDEGAPLVDGPAGSVLEEPCALNITLAERPAEWLAKTRKRIVAATIDAAIVLALWVVASWTMSGDIWGSVVVALGCHSLATAVLGRSLGSRFLRNRTRIRAKRAAPLPEPPVEAPIGNPLSIGLSSN